MEKQGAVGDLHRKSTAELKELLTRQEKILHNQKFIQSLPDKGKKISEFVDRIRHALEAKEKLERKQRGGTSVWTDFEVRYQQAFAQQQRHRLDSTRTPATGPSPGHRDRLTDSSAENSSESSPADGTGHDADTDLVQALQRVALSEEQDSREEAAGESPLQRPQMEKKAYYTAVLEKADSHVTTGRFKPNQLKSAPSPTPSPERVSPLSSEARRQRDRKHLDDITAAKLPPLHHSPALLLSLEESVALQHKQTKKQQELHAQLAAQKLEGLAVSMYSYNPEGGALGSYREVHDDGVASDDDD